MKFLNSVMNLIHFKTLKKSCANVVASSRKQILSIILRQADHPKSCDQ